MSLRERLWRSDDAVSPVVGMILVLGISVVGIAAILYWGLPAIDEMKANVEHRSLESQFQELDATIKELVAGTTEKTAKRWQPTLNRGQVVVVNESEGWVYSVVPYSATTDHAFVYAGFDDTDHGFSIRIPAGATDVAVPSVTAYRMTSTTAGQDLVVSTSENSITALSSAAAWTAGTTKDLFLFYDGQKADLGNATIRFQIEDAGTTVGEAWYVPAGRIDYRLEAGVSPKTVSQNNGAVLSGNGDSYALLNAPPIPPASTTSGIPRHFARAVVLNGTTSFAGEDRFNVLVTLYATYTLASGYDCAESTHSDCVERVQVYSFGEYREPWYAYLSSEERGYTFTEETEDVVIGGETVTVHYLEDTPALADPVQWMGYTLLQSTVHLTGSS